MKSSKKIIRNNSKAISGLKAKFVQSASEIVISARYLKNSIKGKRVSKYLHKNDIKIKSALSNVFYINT